MSAARLIERLHGVKKTGSDSWQAKCPAHNDRKASLSIRETADGRVLVHDFAGCAVNDVIGAVGLELQDLFPSRATSHHRPRERNPFPPPDILRAVAPELLVIAILSAQMVDEIPPARADHERLIQAAARVLAAVDEWGLDFEAARIRRELLEARAARIAVNAEERGHA